MAASLFKQIVVHSFDSDPPSHAAAWGLLLLRAGTGVLVFWIHGWHKVLEAAAHLRDGAPWRLAEEIAEMGMPAPVASALAATAVQFACAPLLALGLFTRLCAAALTAVLAGAVAQNLLAGRDPQLALLYTLNAAAFILLGGGRLSLDAKLRARSHPHPVR